MTTVSVIVPCRNEHADIAAFCANVLRQRLPPATRLQLLIADGRSDDGTREALQALAAGEPQLVVLDNPARTAASGLNAALAVAQGDVIVRMDVHTSYADDYIAQCLAALAETGADNVGGAWHAVPPPGAGPMQRAVAAAFQSRWVAGGARSRQRDFDGWVDTVYLGCWPRATFARWGGFDETLVRNQDDEHNLRIHRGGGRVWQSSRIRSAYQPRSRLHQVARQYLQYGHWKPFVMRKHGQAASLRHLLPAVLVGGAVVLAVVALWNWWTPGAVWPLVAWLAAYGAAVAAMTIGAALDQRVPWSVLWRLPAVIAVYHLAYGVGSLIGWCNVLCRRTRPIHSGFDRLSR